MKKPRLLLADDSMRVLAAVYKLLNAEFDIVGCVLNGEQAVEAALSLQPDVVVLDILMPELDGIKAARRLGELGSKARIVFLTEIEDPNYTAVAAAALHLADHAFVFKSCLETDLPLAIAAVLDGRPFHSSGQDDSRPKAC